jgi:hypothetical protein
MLSKNNFECSCFPLRATYPSHLILIYLVTSNYIKVNNTGYEVPHQCIQLFHALFGTVLKHPQSKLFPQSEKQVESMKRFKPPTLYSSKLGLDPIISCKRRFSVTGLQQ